MITKKAEYAISALAELARQEKGVRITSRSIAQRRAIPGNLIVQLLSLMREAGWVTGTRGPSGGIELNRDPARITLRQVIELIDGPIGITRCVMRERPCNNQVSCSLRGVWFEAQQKMMDVLESVTIKELADAAD